MRKIITLVLMVALCCTALTGCYGMVADIQINEDGSGAVKWCEGMTKEYLEVYNEQTGETDEEVYEFEYNGIKFYGKGSAHESTFASAERFNKSLDLQNEKAFKLVDHGDGNITMLVKLTTKDTKDWNTEISAAAGTPEEQEELRKYAEKLTVVYEIDFPSAVKQTRGPMKGVTITDKHIVIDMLQMNDEVKEDVTLEFTNVDESKSFTDVTADKWYYDAVAMIARSGFVTGVGNDLFNPEGTLTYAEFCQLVARAKGFEVGEENGYWAAKAIAACIKAGYILDRGEITPDNYNVAIPREAAVSAMYIARPAHVKTVKKIVKEKIPDFEEISPEYQENVLKAYGCEITNGVDANRTFLPKNNLKRSEVCQLFFNLDWTIVGK